MISRWTATNGGRGTAARYEQLILIAQMIGCLWRSYREHIQIQAQLTDVRMQFLNGYLTTTSAIVDIRVIGIHKVSGVLSYNTAARL